MEPVLRQAPVLEMGNQEMGIQTPRCRLARVSTAKDHK